LCEISHDELVKKYKYQNKTLYDKNNKLNNVLSIYKSNQANELLSGKNVKY